jgi:hypothetical protein
MEQVVFPAPIQAKITIQVSPLPVPLSLQPLEDFLREQKTLLIC